MQLTFPNGEHESVALRGEVIVGSRSGSRVCLAGSGLAPHHASFLRDRRGLWHDPEGSEEGSVLREYSKRLCKMPNADRHWVLGGLPFGRVGATPLRPSLMRVAPTME